MCYETVHKLAIRIRELKAQNQELKESLESLESSYKGYALQIRGTLVATTGFSGWSGS